MIATKPPIFIFKQGRGRATTPTNFFQIDTMKISALEA
jgi:hypothetical protein